MRKIIVKNSEEYISKRGKRYEIRNVQGILVAFSEGQRCPLTKEIRDRFKADHDAPGSFTIYSNGGCAVSPGGVGGYGVVIINDESGEITELSEGYAQTTNNRMEILGAVSGIRACPEGSTIHLISASQYVVKTMNGIFRKMKNRDLWAQLDKACAGKTVTASLMRGNENKYCNRISELTTKAMYSPRLRADYGYQHDGKRDSANHKTEEKSGAMLIQIDIDGDSDKRAEMQDPSMYAMKYEINQTCAESMKAFWEEGTRSFSAYAQLKTGGQDRFSSMNGETLKSEVGDDMYRQARKYISETDAYTALRWKCRGLSLSDSIRKVLVNKEISAKANRNKEHY